SAPVDKMREHAVVSRCLFQARQHCAELGDRLVAGEPSTLDGDHDRHDAEPGTTNSDEIIVRIAGRLLAVACKAALRMCSFPEEAERLPLNQIEKFAIGFGERRGKGICTQISGRSSELIRAHGSPPKGNVTEITI